MKNEIENKITEQDENQYTGKFIIYRKVIYI